MAPSYEQVTPSTPLRQNTQLPRLPHWLVLGPGPLDGATPEPRQRLPCPALESVAGLDSAAPTYTAPLPPELSPGFFTASDREFHYSAWRRLFTVQQWALSVLYRVFYLLKGVSARNVTHDPKHVMWKGRWQGIGDQYQSYTILRQDSEFSSQLKTLEDAIGRMK